MYTARQLSFAGVTFDVKEVPVQDDYITMYDMSVELVSSLVTCNVYVWEGGRGGWEHVCVQDACA